MQYPALTAASNLFVRGAALPTSKGLSRDARAHADPFEIVSLDS